MLRITHKSENEEKEYLLMTHDEKRACRRELINLVIHEKALEHLLYLQSHPERFLSYAKQFTRQYETDNFGQELKAY